MDNRTQTQSYCTIWHEAYDAYIAQAIEGGHIDSATDLFYRDGFWERVGKTGGSSC